MSNPIDPTLREIEEKDATKRGNKYQQRHESCCPTKPSDIPRDRQTRLDELKKAKRETCDD
jgi:hypothetical protein